MTDTLWVHGNAAQVQLPTQFTNIAYTGPGLQFTIQTEQEGWVHIPVPTLDVLSDTALQVSAVHVATSLTSVVVTEISIWDGPTRIHHETNASYDGNFSVPVSVHTVTTGIGISLYFFFPRNLAADEPQTTTVTINAAGADFAPKPVAVKKPGGAPLDAAVNVSS